ncbi:MAG: transporter substrate-binding domain-containing protein [Proteobacteria bacterium]|nr:transporter substrate-binding domain-containing protein [Pseudomonadota bacterium]
MAKGILVLLCLLPLLLGAHPVPGKGVREISLLVEPGRGPVEGYYKALIELALEKSGVQADVSVLRYPPSQLSNTELVMQSHDAYVIAAGTNAQFERQMLAVRVPIYLGLGSGYRIMLIRKNAQQRLSKVRTLKDLRAFSVGQGQGWSDIPLLENAGLTVVQAPQYRDLFPMLAWGRFDLFSRGLFEVYPEYESYRAEFPTLAVEEHLVVVYPFAIFFFVSREHQELQQALEQGLSKAYASGELQDLLMAQPSLSDALNRARLESRVRIDLPAYGLTPETMQAIEAYPFVFGKVKGQPPR